MSACSLLDKAGHNHVGEVTFEAGEVTFEAVPALDLSAPALEFEFDKRTQAAEKMIADGLLAAHEEALGVADLLDRTMIALNDSMLLMGLLEGAPGNFHALFFAGQRRRNASRHCSYRRCGTRSASQNDASTSPGHSRAGPLFLPGYVRLAAR